MSTLLRRAASTAYKWRWPVGWWRLRGRASVPVAGERLAFADLEASNAEWWALKARRNEWEAPVVAAFAAALRPGDVVYDVGAWIGPYTLLAARLVGPSGRVISFEPDPQARARLERNIALNGAGNVKVVPIALSDSNGSARLSGGESEAVVGASGEIEVQTMTLPDFIAQEGAPDVVKVDIEGGELRLDRAALGRARSVFLEVHVPAFRSEGVEPGDYLDAVAGGRPVARLEDDAENYNVKIG
jgi:FkbM family methyltransferase